MKKQVSIFIGSGAGRGRLSPSSTTWLSPGHLWCHDPLLVSCIIGQQYTLIAPSNFHSKRHPDPSSRPTASDTVLALMESEEAVLKVPEEDAAICKMAGILGAPLEAGQGMYPKLQEIYYSSLKTKASVP